MRACRVTPRRSASRSSASTTQDGKSTLTRRGSSPGRRALSTSKALEHALAVVESPIKLRRGCKAGLFFPCAPDRDDADRCAAARPDCRPVFAIDDADRQEAKLIRTKTQRRQFCRRRPKACCASTKSIPCLSLLPRSCGDRTRSPWDRISTRNFKPYAPGRRAGRPLLRPLQIGRDKNPAAATPPSPPSDWRRSCRGSRRSTATSAPGRPAAPGPWS